MVDFRFRLLAFTGVNAYFRGACAEPLRRLRLRDSPVTLVPPESRPLHSNQLINEGSLQKGSLSNNLIEKSLSQ
ncbi:hypothetical protein [Fictibacillus sp. KU28468]|uniref:hypothetical protein n=1 Tax=Fictibacillus sp. KU28468 TaxID=2991053 RepID=UPI00223E2564|nr:hypothetical protein [Fictibacillus sp. KU28468]UZJ79015.1 hypothetical protein OKX00_00525 [Fictibacillus sp. KU28468]